MDEVRLKKLQRAERTKQNYMTALELSCADIDKEKTEQLKKSYLLKAIWLNNKPNKIK